MFDPSPLAKYIFSTLEAKRKPSSLLKPIGDDRREHVQPSKGKRAKKRARQDGQTYSTEQTRKAWEKPEIFHHISVGLNEVCYLLEIEARRSVPKALAFQCPFPVGEKKRKRVEPEEEPNPLIAVFVAFTDMDGSNAPQLFSRLPDLIARASLSLNRPNVHLASLPKGSSERLADAMGLHRAEVLGLRKNAPGISALAAFLRETVALCTIPTLELE